MHGINSHWDKVYKIYKKTKRLCYTECMGATPPSGDGIPSDQNRAGRKFRFSGGGERKKERKKKKLCNRQKRSDFSLLYYTFVLLLDH